MTLLGCLHGQRHVDLYCAPMTSDDAIAAAAFLGVFVVILMGDSYLRRYFRRKGW